MCSTQAMMAACRRPLSTAGSPPPAGCHRQAPVGSPAMGWRRVAGAPGGIPSVGQSVMHGRRHVEVGADLHPDLPGADAGLQRLIDAAITERCKYVVLGHRRSPQRPEMGSHQGAELGETHGPSLPSRSASGQVASGCASGRKQAPISERAGPHGRPGPNQRARARRAGEVTASGQTGGHGRDRVEQHLRAAGDRGRPARRAGAVGQTVARPMTTGAADDHRPAPRSASIATRLLAMISRTAAASISRRR